LAATTWGEGLEADDFSIVEGVDNWDPRSSDAAGKISEGGGLGDAEEEFIGSDWTSDRVEIIAIPVIHSIIIKT
jgi:hypothetical protein